MVNRVGITVGVDETGGLGIDIGGNGVEMDCGGGVGVCTLVGCEVGGWNGRTFC